MKMNTTCAALALTLGLGAAANAAVIVGTTYVYDNAPDADATHYLDDTGTQLTDGVRVDTGASNVAGDPAVSWANTTSVNITFDLGGTYDVDTVSIGAAGISSWGKYSPDDVTFEGSNDNFATAGTALTIASQDGFNALTNGTNYTSETNNIQLSGTDGYTHLRVIFDGGNTGGGNGYMIDEIIIDGTAVAAVPEPSSTALLGLGGLALILRRRK